MVTLSEVFRNMKDGGLYRRLINEDKAAADFARQEENAIAEPKSLGETVGNFLFGKRVAPTDSIGAQTKDENGNTIINSTVSQNPRTGGVFNDFVGGYKDNRFNPFDVNQFGEKKNLATRLGEGFGSIVRFGESVPGRALITAGLVKAFGGSPLEAVAYGGTAGMLNQANRNADRMYRNDLIQSQQNALQNSPEFTTLKPEEQQAQMQGIADTINNYRGYMNKDIYSNLINTQQIRDNADWRKMYFDAQQKNLEEQREWQRQEAAMRRADAAANRDFQYYNANLGHQDRLAALDTQNSKNKGDDFGDMRQQLDNFAASFDTVDNPYRYRIAGKGSEFFNTLTENEANFNAQRTLLFNQIARKLGGEKGVLSDNDIKRIEAALPTLADTKKQKEAKMKAVYALLNIKEGNQGANDPLGIL